MALLSLCIVSAVLILLIIRLEKLRPRPRDLMPVVVLAALAILGRLLFTPLPNFQPATALIILAGLYFGKRSGMLCGMVVAFVSNFFLGQGPWTPWQMLAWGLVGYFAGELTRGRISLSSEPADDVCVASVRAHRGRTRLRDLRPLENSQFSPYVMNGLIVYVYGAAASLLFGAVMDLQFFIGFAWSSGLPGLITKLLMGLPLNISHAVSTVIFLAATLIPWGKKLQRLKTKYGIRSL